VDSGAASSVLISGTRSGSGAIHRVTAEFGLCFQAIYKRGNNGLSSEPANRDELTHGQHWRRNRGSQLRQRQPMPAEGGTILL
jgi:hypothetical protein